MRREDLKKKILNQIDDEKAELIKLCSDMIRIPSENPPGDTTDIAKFIKGYLEERGLKAETYEPKKSLVSLVAQQGSGEKPCLVLNGHIDEIPAGTMGWDFPPFCGEVREDKILGRGAICMKGGLAASIFAFTLLGKLETEIPGKLVLNPVADEVSGGKWGTEWLLDNIPALLGDACLIGEPGGMRGVVIGEKGKTRLRVKAIGVAGHPVSIGTVNAIVKMSKIIPAIESLMDMEAEIPEDLADLIREEKPFYEEEIGKGAGEALDHVTVNIGIIRGGTNAMVAPELCEVDVDVCLPPGITPEEAKKEMDARLSEAGLENVECDFIKEYPFHRPAMYTPTSEKIVKLVYENARDVTGEEPKYFIKHWGTDGKFFRRKGIPTVIYGPTQINLGAPNEYVLIDDLIKVTKVHSGTIIDFYDWE